MTLSRILTTLFAAFLFTGTAQAHDIGDGGAHSHFDESQNLAALFMDNVWLILAVAATLALAGIALGRWKRSRA